MLIEDLRKLVHICETKINGMSPDILQHALADAVVFEITNVADYVNTTEVAQKGGHIAALIPECAPVASATMWFEWRDSAIPSVHRVGCLMIVLDYTSPEMVGSRAALDAYEEPDARWFLFCHVFQQHRTDMIAAHEIAYVIPVLPDGRPGRALHLLGLGGADPAQEDHTPCYGFCLTALFALTFCHCRNIAIEDHGPSRQVLRAAARRHEALLTYKTLVIDPGHVVVKHEQDRVRRGEIVPKALHLVRGHFAEYTADKPLFGNPKNVGRFFVPLHTRGTLKAGAVIKDYNVKAPGTPRPCAP